MLTVTVSKMSQQHIKPYLYRTVAIFSIKNRLHQLHSFILALLSVLGTEARVRRSQEFIPHNHNVLRPCVVNACTCQNACLKGNSKGFSHDLLYLV